jgi:hypothetical protein
MAANNCRVPTVPDRIRASRGSRFHCRFVCMDTSTPGLRGRGCSCQAEGAARQPLGRLRCGSGGESVITPSGARNCEGAADGIRANHPRPHRGEPDGIDAPADRGGPPPRRSQSLRVRPTHSGTSPTARQPTGRWRRHNASCGRPREGRSKHSSEAPTRSSPSKRRCTRATSTRSSSRRCPDGCRSGCGVT